MLYPALEEKLREARRALDGGTSESVIELCKRYLALLAEYRAWLYSLPDTIDLDLNSQASSRASVDEVRKEVRAAIEETTRERVWAEALVLSFTAISGYGAVETFNRQKYKGRDDWTLSSGGVGLRDGADVVQKMSVQEAVEKASLLRREEHVAGNAARAGARPLATAKSFRPRAETPEKST